MFACKLNRNYIHLVERLNAAVVSLLPLTLVFQQATVHNRKCSTISSENVQILEMLSFL